MKRIKVKQINNHIWLLNDNDESTGYLVTGSERGLIIDTMTGYGNVRKVAEEITDFPLTVVNTHGHLDHIKEFKEWCVNQELDLKKLFLE